MRLFFLSLIICISLSSCSEYQSALKSEDIKEKFDTGTKLYEAEKWNKANRLFQQIVPKYAGKPQAEKLMFMYAMTFYKMKDFRTANYQFERFSNIYKKSEKVDEAAFYGAKSYYWESPVYSKFQESTYKATDKLQLFVNAYPNSSYLAEANALVKELEFKLEKKAFEIAKQYNKISDYKASVKSFNNFLLEFPGSSLREDAMFYRFLAMYNLEIRSVEYLKGERINEAENYYNTLIKTYPETKYLDEATIMHQNLLKEQAIYVVTSK